MYRQGDVFIIPVKNIPVSASRIQTEGEIVLAYGEVTGHSHSIQDGTTMLFHGPQGTVYLDVTEHTEVRHQEHATIPLAPGAYKIARQREYTPEAIRNVAD